MSTTLSDIRRTIRNITGRQDVNQITDARLDDYIDDFYLHDFPETLKVMQIEEYYKFYTSPNIAIYALPQQYYLVKPPVYVSGYEAGWHQSPGAFFSLWPDGKFEEAAATGDGGINYTFTLTNIPIQAGTLVVSDDTEYFTDDGAGVLTGSGGGAGVVNYTTGVITVAFAVGVTIGESIFAQYHPYVASRPRDILFYNQQFELRPIPDKTYEVRVLSLIRPTQMAGAASSPEFTEWCSLIAYGAALKIFVENGDWDEYKSLYAVFQQQKNLAQRRALKQLSNQRAQTNYELGNGRASWPIYPLF